jgi:predicted nucleic acid-binding protein
MVAVADTSFLFSIYGNDVHTPQALEWLRESGCVILVSEMADYELGNALRFAEFSKRLRDGDAAAFWAQYETDRQAGRIRLEICNLARLVAEARRLSATHTLRSGNRAFDILHVAAALVLKAEYLMTFDSRQKSLAEAEGLKVPF